MFGFLKDGCNDMDLFGYLFQSCGGLHNQLMIDKKYKYDWGSRNDFGVYQNKLINKVHLQIGQRGKRVNEKQEQLIVFAAELIEQHLCDTDLKNNKIKKCVLRFAEMLMKDDFDFRDKSIKTFREELAKFGCVFNF
jgi:hypothetical protein